MSDNSFDIAVGDVFLRFDEVTGELRQILYRYAMNEFFTSFQEEKIDEILLVLGDNPEEKLLMFDDVFDDGLFCACELYEHHTAEELLVLIDSSARSYYSFLCKFLKKTKA